jgi:leucyl-tRNA synthetase
VPHDADTKTIEDIAKNNEKVRASIVDKEIKKIITVPGRLINIVTG